MGGRTSIPACAAAMVAVACLALLGPAAASAAPTKPVATKSKARAFTFGQRTLRTGMRGKDVRVLQNYLGKLGFPTAVDGAYGKATSKSVRKLETQKQWPIDGRVSKKDARRIQALLTRPSGVFYAYGVTRPGLILAAQKQGSTSVEVADAGGVAVAALSASFGGAEQQTVTWDGLTSSGTYAPESTYSFRIGSENSANAAITGGQVRPFLFRHRAFPVPGTHSYGGAGSRFGAPRGGHTHQGQDLAAACGEKLYVAEGGVLRVDAYQASGAGYYIVIDGALSGTDYVYMHMLNPSWAVPGQIVYTGQQIGKVGNTGSSGGCHLHFEHWTYPGWYQGGFPFDPLYELQAWDAYS